MQTSADMSSSAAGGHRLKAVIFDLDGVIANPYPTPLQAREVFSIGPGLDLPDARLFEAGYVTEGSPPRGRSDCTVIRGA
jgi:hypothetical protein